MASLVSGDGNGSKIPQSHQHNKRTYLPEMAADARIARGVFFRLISLCWVQDRRLADTAYTPASAMAVPRQLHTMAWPLRLDYLLSQPPPPPPPPPLSPFPFTAQPKRAPRLNRRSKSNRCRSKSHKAREEKRGMTLPLTWSSLVDRVSTVAPEILKPISGSTA